MICYLEVLQMCEISFGHVQTASFKKKKKKSDIVILFGFGRLSEYLILVLFSTAVS